MTGAIDSYGVQLKRWDGVSAFVAIAEVANLTPPKIMADSDEVSAHDGAGWKEYIPTLLDLDEFSATLNFDPGGAGHVALITDLTTKALTNYQILFPDATVWAFATYVVGVEVQEMAAGGGGGAIRAVATFRPSNDAAPTLS